MRESLTEIEAVACWLGHAGERSRTCQLKRLLRYLLRHAPERNDVRAFGVSEGEHAASFRLSSR